jgi:hypothetical protein
VHHNYSFGLGRVRISEQELGKVFVGYFELFNFRELSNGWAGGHSKRGAQGTIWANENAMGNARKSTFGNRVSGRPRPAVWSPV